MIVVDAGVIVAALDATDAHHDASVAALRESLEGGTLVLPASAYAECLVWPFRAGDHAVANAEALIDTLPATVVPADRTIARTAARLRSLHGTLRLPDALVIATAIELGADRILTTDRGWPPTGVPAQVLG